MPFITLPTTRAKIYVPEEKPACAKKHACKTCYACQMCTDSRCQLCRQKGVNDGDDGEGKARAQS